MVRRPDPFHIGLVGLVALIVAYLGLLFFSQITYLTPGRLLDSLKDKEIQFALGLSLKTSFLAAGIAIFLGTPIAYFLARTNFRGKVLVDTLLDLPTVISPVALGAVMLIFFNTPLGLWIQEYLFPVVFTVAGIIVAQATIALSLVIRLVKAVFETIDPHFEIAARVLGESKWGAFRRVTLPLARPGILSAFILAWARALGEFGATVTLAGATKFKTETLPIAIYLNLASVRIEKAVILIWILLILSCLVLLSVRYLYRRGTYL